MEDEKWIRKTRGSSGKKELIDYGKRLKKRKVEKKESS